MNHCLTKCGGVWLRDAGAGLSPDAGRPRSGVPWREPAEADRPRRQCLLAQAAGEGVGSGLRSSIAYCHLHQFYSTVQKSCLQSLYFTFRQDVWSHSSHRQVTLWFVLSMLCEKWTFMMPSFSLQPIFRFIRALNVLSPQILLNSWMFHSWSHFVFASYICSSTLVGLASV